MLNSLVYVSGATVPRGMGAEAEFPCGRLVAVKEAPTVASPGVTSFVYGTYMMNLS